MVSGSRLDGGTQIISAGVRKTIQSIKEIVGNHSEADIYIMLKETNMDPNETTQKLLNQDPFHEVKRKRDKRKENTGYASSVEPTRHIVHVEQRMKSQSFSDRNIRRGGYARNSVPGVSREFRVVRDNRVNQNTNRETKPESLQWTTSTNEQVTLAVPGKSSTAIGTERKPSGAKNSELQKPSQALNGKSDLGRRHAEVANSNGTPRQGFSGEAGSIISNSAARVQGSGTHDSQSYSVTLASSNSVVGVYSSATDPVHVPSLDSRSSVAVGAIRREVGVVGNRKQASENTVKQSSGTGSSFSSPVLGKELPASTESFQPAAVSQSSAPESVMSSMAVSRSFVSNQYYSKPQQQVVGHQKAPQPNMEWKPKSSQKSNPGVIGTAAPISPSANNSSELKSEAAHLQDKILRVNISDDEHVIIPPHLRVPEADRTQLTFGSFGAGLDSMRGFVSGFKEGGSAEESNGELSVSASSSILEASGEDVSGGYQIELVDDQANSGSDSPASVAASEHPLPDMKESSCPLTLESYADIGLVRNDTPPFASAEQQQQEDPPGLPTFSAYDPQTGYDVTFFRQTIDENVRGEGLPFPQEALSSHIANNIPASTVAMVQQQPMTQLYPQVHVSHFPNFMPYRQFLSPVYVPPMAVPGYSSNAAYPHPSNGSSYLLMPGGSSHLAAGGLKYGSQQYKPVPAGSATAFGNYTNLAGYAVNAPGAVGSTTGLDDSTRIKYKEGNLYVPNPQAETSEIWIQTPRDHPGLQSAPYYNVPGQVPHAAYLPSHTGHASFNAAAAAQSAHVQFPGLYHHPQQPAAIANPHHMVPGMGGNLGVGVATPGAQVGTYQQPQLSHLNWTTNF
ncbi:uncharacterized protein LOC122087109 isoform X2 [Macadamia integrifolia]|uniref:uncharacterized protein LOC122087109 isoform X2 n=1 Tax=Macadamia integrifolia TaxID=60698 RepID=UPI001C4FED86|nr:uncharacterized protein LOC122087109 isoform X2 [Macadamia integrifolia]